jgi:uncharacterized membrane protein
MGPERLKVMERWNLVFAGLFILVAAIFFEAPEVWGVATGSLLCCANFYSIRKIWQSLLTGNTERRQAIQILFLLKTIALVALVFVVIRFLPVNPAAFAVGVSVFLLSVGIESARFALCGPPVMKS